MGSVIRTSVLRFGRWRHRDTQQIHSPICSIPCVGDDFILPNDVLVQSLGTIFSFNQASIVDDLYAPIHAFIADRKRLPAGRIITRDQLMHFGLRLIAK